MELPQIKIVAITQPRVEGIRTPDEFLAYAARVSNPSNQMNNETGPNLLKYCVKNNHWSVFEMVNVCMEITTTRDIARQILRHRSFSFQEFSQRYGNPLEGLGIISNREARLQDNKNRQNSIETDDRKLQITFEEFQKDIRQRSSDAYKWAIENGIAKEQARVFLPEGLTVSRMYMSGSLRSWITYVALREKSGTQKEHKVIAKECKNLLENEFQFLSIINNENNEWII